jgi:hypothetical protein
MPTSSIPASGGGGLRPYYQKFTSSGTFTLPDGYGAANPLLINIQVIGGGGGGATSRVTPTGNLPARNIQGNYNDYFGNGQAINHTFNAVTLTHTVTDFISSRDGAGGGSGGIAQTQMSLTSNLTVTVGAAGARAGITGNNTSVGIRHPIFQDHGLIMNSGNYYPSLNGNNADVYAAIEFNYNTQGGTGGTSTAGAVSAVGGSAGAASAQINVVTPNVAVTGGRNTASTQTHTFNGTTTLSGGATYNAGAAGQPAGTVGGAVPLLGALAGGSGSTTPVYGAFGIGGIKTDGGTHTGVEGTGGGFGSIGASGAIIITYWA